MLGKLVLCLSVAVVAQARILDTKQAEENTVGESSDGIGPKELVEGIEYARSSVKTLQNSIDELTPKILKGDKTDEDWFGIMGDMANFMKGGAKLFHETAFGINHAAARMFSGNHGFKKDHRCSNLFDATKSPGFGTEDFLPKLEIALAQDLICFHNVLNEMASMKISTDPACPPSEDDVIALLGNSMKDIFLLMNDGTQFYMAVHTATSTYDKGLHQSFLTAMESDGDLVRQLIRALKTKP